MDEDLKLINYLVGELITDLEIDHVNNCLILYLDNGTKVRIVGSPNWDRSGDYKNCDLDVAITEKDQLLSLESFII